MGKNGGRTREEKCHTIVVTGQRRQLGRGTARGGAITGRARAKVMRNKFKIIVSN